MEARPLVRYREKAPSERGSPPTDDLSVGYSFYGKRMKKLRTIAFTARSSRKIPSVNSMYKSRVTTIAGRPVAQVYVVKEVRDWKQDIAGALRGVDFEGEAPWIFDRDRRFSLSLIFLIGSALNNSDVDNRIKAVQDCLFKRLGLNDSRVLRITAEKRLVQGATHEVIGFELTENLADPIFNNLEPVPRPAWIRWIGADPGDSARAWLKERRYRETLDPGDSEADLYVLDPGTPEYSVLLGEALREAWSVVTTGYPGTIGVVLPSGTPIDEVAALFPAGHRRVRIFAGTPADFLEDSLDPSGWKGRRYPRI